MPKKSKIVQSKNHAPAEASGSRPAREARSRKKPKPRDKKIATMESEKGPTPAEAGGPGEASEEQIRLRAYFISERRRRFALSGDAESDWLEAKRQLLAELDPR